MNNIKVSELKKVFEKIIKKLENEYGVDTEMKLNTVIYKHIPTEKWDLFKKPEDWFTTSKIEQGNLQDDVLQLKKLTQNKDQICTFVDFDRLASVLREISNVENPVV